MCTQGPTPVVELAELLGLERTTLTRSAEVLERRGWLGTAPSEDARERPLQITPEGLGKLEEAFPAWKAVQEAVDRGEWEEPGFPGSG
jgi:DNA-binding MarR family transcriptional regulator